MRPVAILATFAISHSAAAAKSDNAAVNTENGLLVGHLFPACKGRRAGGHKKWTMTPDVNCLSTPGLGLQVLSPAVCANGTRAKLALFADSKCAGRKVTAENGLIDIQDSEIGRRSCLSTWNELRVVGEDDLQKVRGVAFFCDPSQLPEKPKENEPETEKPVTPSSTKNAAVSHNSCWTDKHGPTAPTFLHPAPDTCQRLSAGRQLRVYSAGVCEGGSRPKLARFKGSGCRPGDALPLVEIKDDDRVIKKCLSWADEDHDLETSYGFACEGVKESPDQGRSRGGQGGSTLGFVLVPCFIALISILGCMFAALRRARLVERIMNLIRGSREGGIQL